METLEDYFEFLDPTQIRIKGHRIGIEHVIELYQAGQPPEEIARQYPTLRLEDVYATIVNCLRNQGEIDAYLARIEEIARRDMAESDAHLSPARRRLLKWRQQQQVADPRNQGFWKI
jgi:uncharacterized protein (DUF433 family)